MRAEPEFCGGQFRFYFTKSSNVCAYELTHVSLHGTECMQMWEARDITLCQTKILFELNKFCVTQSTSKLILVLLVRVPFGAALPAIVFENIVVSQFLLQVVKNLQTFLSNTATWTFLILLSSFLFSTTTIQPKVELLTVTVPAIFTSLASWNSMQCPTDCCVKLTQRYFIAQSKRQPRLPYS